MLKIDNGDKNEYSRIMPKGVYQRTEEGEAKRAEAIRQHLPSTAFKPGVNSYPESKFQKGYTPFNKGKTGLNPGAGAPKGTKPWNYGLKGLKRNRIKKEDDK